MGQGIPTQAGTTCAPRTPGATRAAGTSGATSASDYSGKPCSTYGPDNPYNPGFSHRSGDASNPGGTCRSGPRSLLQLGW